MSNEDPFGPAGEQFGAYRAHQLAVGRVAERISTLGRELDILKLPDGAAFDRTIQLSIPVPNHRAEPKTVDLTRWEEGKYNDSTDKWGAGTFDRTVLDAILPIVIAMKEAELAELQAALSDVLARYQ